MKKLSVALIVIIVFFAGCAIDQGQPQIEIDPESQAVIGKIMGRHAGDALAEKYPDIAESVKAICNDIIEKDDPDIIVTLAKSVVTVLADNQIKDKLLVADIKDILDMITVKSGVEITSEKIAVIKAVAKGLIEGINLY